MTKAELLKTAKPIRLDTRQVKATLNGTMTEIRAPIKGRFEVCKTKSGEVVDIQRVDDNDRHIGSIKPPYQKGDVLYVEETWTDDVKLSNGFVIYKADGWDRSGLRWKPSVHMPREAARIFLLVTEIKVDRLHDIAEEDAKAEGFNAGDKRSANSSIAVTAKQAFMWTWQAIYDKRQFPWLSNPWVRVTKFERLEEE